MQTKNTDRIDEISLIFGVLCLSVVYLHSGFVEKGFDIYTLGMDSYFLRRITSLLLMMVVPIFFILWGYLSNKYLDDSEDSFSFVKRKFLKFYPIYLFSFIINVIVRWEDVRLISFYKIFSGILGIYYEPIFTGGHIFMVVFLCILSMSFLKQLITHQNKNTLVLILIAALIIILKLAEREQTLCYYRYFGYFCAYWMGVFLKNYELLDYNKNRTSILVIRSTVIGIGLLALISEVFNWKGLEIGYLPNSPEQLCLSFGVLFFILFFIGKVFSGIPILIKKFLCRIGNHAYAHFIIHAYVIRILIFIGDQIQMNRVLLQLTICCITSAISIYFILPVLNYMGRFFSSFLKSFGFIKHRYEA